jgi:putative tricarboxylic transport membrane protein
VLLRVLVVDLLPLRVEYRPPSTASHSRLAMQLARKTPTYDAIIRGHGIGLVAQCREEEPNMADRIVLACTVILTVVYLYASTQIPVLAIGDPLGPKAFPRLLGIAMLIAAGFFALELWRDRAKKQEAPEAQAPRFEGPIVMVLLAVVAWTALYYFVFEWLGYILATAIYLLAMTMWFHRGKSLVNIVSVLLFVFVTYFVFLKLEVRLPPGVLPL